MGYSYSKPESPVEWGYLKRIYSPDNPDEATIDIVAVHGLNLHSSISHAEGTWTKSNKLWLKDFLPHRIPDARVFLFSYNSNVVFATAADSIEKESRNLLNRLRSKRRDCQTRPLIFICHSMGGILVKQAILEALTSLDPGYLAIQRSTKGIVFFSTPHRGGNGASLGDVFANIGLFLLRNPSNGYLRLLKKNSELAENTAYKFRYAAQYIKFLTFYELLPVRKIKIFNFAVVQGIIVDDKSAILGLGNEEDIPMYADHSEICKFDSETNERYEQVMDNLCDLVQYVLKQSQDDVKTGEGSTALIMTTRDVETSRITGRSLQSHVPASAQSSSAQSPSAISASQERSEIVSIEEVNPSAEHVRENTYEPLPDEYHIRLFCLLAGNESDEILGRLCLCNLSDPVPYEALSYVWSLGYTRKINILSDDGKRTAVNVTDAIYAALHALRDPTNTRFLWIDALSINLQDIRARSCTVQLMPRIFEAASQVCVWLGEEDHGTRIAFDFIKRSLLDLAALDQLTADSSLSSTWAAVARLLKRSWFSRRWIIQEISVARNAAIHCGKLVIGWQDFADGVRLFATATSALRKQSMPEQHYQIPLLDPAEEFPAVNLVEFVDNAFTRSHDHRIQWSRLPLHEIVITMAAAEASSPIDYVYALVGLASEVSQNQHSNGLYTDPDSSSQALATLRPIPLKPIHIDYGKSALEVFAEFVDFAIKGSQSLDIICSPWAPENLSEAPSWICPAYGPFRPGPYGIYSRVSGDPFVGRSRPGQALKWKYNAAGPTKPSWSMSENKILEVEGCIVGRIATLEDTAVEGTIPGTWPKLAQWNDFDALPPIEFSRTLVGDRGPQSLGGSGVFKRACGAAYRNRTVSNALIVPLWSSAPNTPHLVAEFLHLVEAVSWGRRMFVSEHGSLGLAPRAAETGDIVCVLYGCSVPVVLRNVENSQYRLIGDCYLDRYMDGQALKLGSQPAGRFAIV